MLGYELGIRLSDVFFANKILLVEGHIDKVYYRIGGEKLESDLKSPRKRIATCFSEYEKEGSCFCH